MQTFLFYLERAWLTAAFAAGFVGIYQGVQLKTILNPSVYFPLFCVVFCVLIYSNIRSQRLFRARIKAENQPKS